MDANDMTGVRGPKQSCHVDIEKVTIIGVMMDQIPIRSRSSWEREY